MNDMKTIWESKSEDVMRELLILKDRYVIEELKTIELYGGDGHSLSDKMAEQSVSFVGYDINPDKEEGFKNNIPNGEFRCGDSVRMMRTMQEGEIGTYNLISVDSPICIYGEGYCEHFEILQYIYKLLRKGRKVICVFPVTKEPYDTEKAENRAWMKRRAEFYESEEKNLDLDAALKIYDRIFYRQNLKVVERCYVCREYRNGIDWMYEYMYVLEK